MVRKRPGRVEQAASEHQRCLRDTGVDPHLRQRQASYSAQPHERPADHHLWRAYPGHVHCRSRQCQCPHHDQAGSGPVAAVVQRTGPEQGAHAGCVDSGSRDPRGSVRAGKQQRADHHRNREPDQVQPATQDQLCVLDTALGIVKRLRRPRRRRTWPRRPQVGGTCGRVAAAASPQLEIGTSGYAVC